MPKVVNLSEEGITILRWRLLPRSRIFVDPQQRLVEDVPAYVAYSDQAKALANQGVIRIEGYRPPTTETPPPTTETPSPSDTVSSERREKRSRKLER